MDSEQKRQLALKILALTEMYPRLPGMSDKMMETIRKGRARTTAIYAEVYAKFFSDTQLNALYEFHNSEMGRSIKAARQLINEEAGRLINELNKTMEAEAQTGKDGLIIKRAEHEEKDHDV